jgi:hypothetical protein
VTAITAGIEIAPQPWHTDEGRARLLEFREARYERWQGIVYVAFRKMFTHQAQRSLAAVADSWDLSTGSAPESMEDVEKHVEPQLLNARALQELLDTFTRVVMRIFRVEGPGAFEFADAARPRPKLDEDRAARQGSNLPPFSWQASAVQHIRRRANHIRGVNETRWKAIRKTIEEVWRDPNWDRGARTMQRALAREFGFDAARSLRIARTESGAAANGAAFAGYQAGGAPYKGWLSAEDEHVRPTHWDQNGTIIGIDEFFPNGLKHPNDPDGAAEEVINCRCTLTPEFEPA